MYYHKFKDLLFDDPQKLFLPWRQKGIGMLFLNKFRKLTSLRIGKIVNSNNFPCSNIMFLKNIEIDVIDTDFPVENIKVPFSMITTIKNESANIVEFLKSIESQSLIPEELIIVDGGSTDGTVDLVKEFIDNSSLNVVFMEHPGINIAAGRNMAINEAGNEILVLTDAGCKLDMNFCKNLVGSFMADDRADMVGGIYKPIVKTDYVNFFIPDWNNMDWQEFLPSARSLAIKRSIALDIGGFPEYLTLTGEDTLFDVDYRRASKKWVFNKKAFVSWSGPLTEQAACKVAYTYGKGDGESGVGDYRFANMFYDKIMHYKHHGDTDIPNPIMKSMFMGYMDGCKMRAKAEIEKRKISGVVLILSIKSLSNKDKTKVEVIKSLISSNCKVFFVNVNKGAGLKKDNWFDMDYSLLELASVKDFDWENFIEEYYARIPEKTLVVNPEWHPLLGSLLDKLKSKSGNGIKVVSSFGDVYGSLKEIAPAHKGNNALKEETATDTAKENVNFSGFGKVGNRLQLVYQKLMKVKLYGAMFYSHTKTFGFKETLYKSMRKLGFSVNFNYRPFNPKLFLKPSVLKSNNSNMPDIISFPIMPWFSRKQRSQQLLTRFAENGTRVFRIDRDFLVGKREYKYSLLEVQKNILQVTLSSNRKLSIYTDKIGDDSLGGMLESIDQLKTDFMIGEAVCIVELPFWYPIAKKLKDKYGWNIIYDCMDEHEGFSTNNQAMLSDESEIAREASSVTVSSKYLMDKMSRYNRNCFLIRNATDFNHFSYLPQNDLLKKVRKPIIGYYDAISDWFDIDLIVYAASERKDWNFVIIGGNDSGIDLSLLEKLPNVKLLGEKSYSELPKYLYWFDVCIIPFKLTKLTEATNPVKLYEYLSSGKPVVSTKLPELMLVSEYLYLAGDKDDFVAKIDNALNESDFNLVEKRIQMAKENTWETRYKDLYQAVRNLYPTVSIIIVTYNNLNLTKACIESIYANSHYPNLELVIVDNNSSDGTRDYLIGIQNTYDNISLILNDENRGFAAANNQGIRKSSGENIILLNNDTVVTPGWISKLNHYLKDKSTGMVGPVTNMCGNEAIINVPYDVSTLEGFDEFINSFYKRSRKGDSFEIDMLSMFCVAIRRETVNEIGFLDERFKTGMFEDTDYSYRIKEKGYKIICARDIFIHHCCRASFGKLPSNEYNRIYEENRIKFEEKWSIKSKY
jgi:GT2 family glycosyltransferase/glycosyltransferase involved in cell wall biosynthesis